MSAGQADEERETIVIRGTDFTQVSTVEVLFDGVLMASAPTGSIGEFEIQLPAPFQPRASVRSSITARDAASEVVKTTRVTNLAMTVKPQRASPGTRVRFSGRGFTEPAPVFAHYLFGGKEQRTVRLRASLDEPVRHVQRQAPARSPSRTRAPGRWIMQVDQKREYSPEPDPVWVRRPIDVVEVVP